MPDEPSAHDVGAFQQNFDSTFQQRLLAQLMQDVSLLLRYRHLLRHTYFSDAVLREISRYILHFYDHYGQAPGMQSVRQMVSQEAKANERDTLFAWTDYLYTLDISDGGYVLEQLHGFCVEREYMLAVQKCAKILTNGSDEDKKKIPEIILKAQANLSRTQGSLGIFGIGMTAEQRLAELFTDPIRACILSLWGSLNEICGGYAKQELFVFAAPPNRGKSWVLCHAASSALAQGKKVLFASGEMSSKLSLLRIYSILTGYTEKELAESNDTLLEQVIQQYRVLGAEIVVKHFTHSTINDVRDWVLGVNAQCGWMPEMVIVDYADLFVGEEDDGSSQYRHRIAQVYKRFRDLAVEYDFAAVSASQLNRASLAKDTPGMGDLAEAFEKAAIADILVTLGQTEEELMAFGTLRCYFAKNRNAKRGQTFTLSVDFSRGKLVDQGGVGLETGAHGSPSYSTPQEGTGPPTGVFG